ncbi:MAG: hypothetical protein QM796_20330 [Chthoniobacteraceae bacterium]
MSKGEKLDRVAYSPKEFALLFGREQSYGYRAIYSGRVKSIVENGRLMIPAKEVEKILGKAGEYNGKPKKVPKKVGAAAAWRRVVKQKQQASKPSVVKAATAFRRAHAVSPMPVQRPGKPKPG